MYNNKQKRSESGEVILAVLFLAGVITYPLLRSIGDDIASHKMHNIYRQCSLNFEDDQKKFDACVHRRVKALSYE